MIRHGRSWWAFGVLVALLVAGVLSQFASGEPDGLERVATDQGILEQAVEREGLLAYDSVGGLLGVVLVLAAALTLSWVLRRRSADISRGR